ncbi:MAG: glycosyltransferase [Acidimicrobiia bacterium]
MTRDAVLLSYRLGSADGVSVEAAKWEGALGALGFSVRHVAGELPDTGRTDDIVLPWLAWEPPPGAGPEPDALSAALSGADLVVVENLCSLPLNPVAARATAAALDEHVGRVLFHHHDLPWQRTQFAAVTDLPPDRPGSLHVTINDRSRRELATRGIRAYTVHNAFDVDGPPGDRAATRAALGFGDGEVVVLQPTRAIPRKDVPGGLRLAEAVGELLPERSVRYWLTGPAEDGYGPTLERVLAQATVPVIQGRAASTADAYAAADAVVFPSTWEGFGNPVIESVIARRPLAVAHYPVLDEIRALGFEFFSVDAPRPMVEWLRAPDPAVLATNHGIARRHFSLADLPGRLEAAFGAVGWSTW